MTDGTQILIHHMLSLIALISRRCRTYSTDSFRSIFIVTKDIPRKPVLGNIFYGVTNQLGEVIVLGILTGRIGDIAGKRKVLSNMP